MAFSHRNLTATKTPQRSVSGPRRDPAGGREGVMRKITYNMAMAAGWDEGDRSAKKAGRKKWNRSDWNAAAKKANELLDLMARQTAN